MLWNSIAISSLTAKTSRFVLIEKFFYDGDLSKSWISDCIRAAFADQLRVASDLISPSIEEFEQLATWMHQKQAFDKSINQSKWQKKIFSPDFLIKGFVKVSDTSLRLNLVILDKNNSEEALNFESKIPDLKILINKATEALFNKFGNNQNQLAWSSDLDALENYTLAMLNLHQNKLLACNYLKQALAFDNDFYLARIHFLTCSQIMTAYPHAETEKILAAIGSRSLKLSSAFELLFYQGYFEYFSALKKFDLAELYLVRYRNTANQLLDKSMFRQTKADLLALKLHVAKVNCNDGGRWLKNQFNYLYDPQLNQFVFVKIEAIKEAIALSQKCRNQAKVVHWASVLEKSLLSVELEQTDIFLRNSIILGHAYLEQKNFNLSLQSFYRAEKLFVGLGNQLTLGDAHLYYNIAVIEEQLGNAPQAYKQYRHALDLYRQLNYTGKYYELAKKKVE